MTIRSRRPKTSTHKRPGSKGWATLETPVPGDVLSALTELGVAIDRVIEDEATGHCPAHRELTGKADRHPSWSCNTSTGEHNCFSCGFSGSFVHLVCYVLRLRRDEAVAWVRARGSIEWVRRRLTSGEKRADKRPELTEAALALFTPPPESALRTRALSAEACEHYGVLWDPDRRMWITPIRDPYSGELWGWQEKNERWFRNLPAQAVRKSQTLFGLQQFYGGTAVLVESPLDTARIYTAGTSGGLSSYGAKVSSTQMELIIDVADRLILALDNPFVDRDGCRVAIHIIENYADRIPIRLFNYVDRSKDPGEMEDNAIEEALHTALPSISALRMLKGLYAH
jgi:DNA primase